MPTLGIDIGASKIAAALVTRGRILASAKVILKRRTLPAITAAILEAAESARLGQKISGVGVGVPCAFGRRKKVLGCANISALKPEKIAKLLRKTYRVPVFIENDVKAAALAELKYGIGTKTPDFVFVAFGTGIGGAIVIERKLYKGGLGWAGEFGHMKMPIDWEKLASAQFLKAHKGGNVLRELARNIAVGLINVIYALAPEYIVIGGGLLSIWNKKFEHAITAEMKKLCHSSKIPLPKIVRSRLGEHAGVIGAALLSAVAER